MVGKRLITCAAISKVPKSLPFYRAPWSLHLVSCQNFRTNFRRRSNLDNGGVCRPGLVLCLGKGSCRQHHFCRFGNTRGNQHQWIAVSVMDVTKMKDQWHEQSRLNRYPLAVVPSFFLSSPLRFVVACRRRFLPIHACMHACVLLPSYPKAGSLPKSIPSWHRWCWMKRA